MRIGIDPGNTGAIALLNKNLEFVHVEDMPVTTLNGKKQQVNAVEVCRILERWKSFSSEPLIAYLEKVSAMPGQGVSSMFNFGTGYGILQGVLASLRIGYVLVSPQQWKRRAGLINTEKDKARTVAQQLYPGVELGRKRDIGRADALLIATYGAVAIDD